MSLSAQLELRQLKASLTGLIHSHPDHECSVNRKHDKTLDHEQPSGSSQTTQYSNSLYSYRSRRESIHAFVASNGKAGKAPPSQPYTVTELLTFTSRTRAETLVRSQKDETILSDANQPSVSSLSFPSSKIESNHKPNSQPTEFYDLDLHSLNRMAASINPIIDYSRVHYPPGRNSFFTPDVKIVEIDDDTECVEQAVEALDFNFSELDSDDHCFSPSAERSVVIAAGSSMFEPSSEGPPCHETAEPEDSYADEEFLEAPIPISINVVEMCHPVHYATYSSPPRIHRATTLEPVPSYCVLLSAYQYVSLIHFTLTLNFVRNRSWDVSNVPGFRKNDRL